MAFRLRDNDVLPVTDNTGKELAEERFIRRREAWYQDNLAQSSEQAIDIVRDYLSDAISEGVIDGFSEDSNNYGYTFIVSSLRSDDRYHNWGLLSKSPRATKGLKNGIVEVARFKRDFYITVNGYGLGKRYGAYDVSIDLTQADQGTDAFYDVFKSVFLSDRFGKVAQDHYSSDRGRQVITTDTGELSHNIGLYLGKLSSFIEEYGLFCDKQGYQLRKAREDFDRENFVLTPPPQ